MAKEKIINTKDNYPNAIRTISADIWYFQNECRRRYRELWTNDDVLSEVINDSMAYIDDCTFVAPDIKDRNAIVKLNNELEKFQSLSSEILIRLNNLMSSKVKYADIQNADLELLASDIVNEIDDVIEYVDMVKGNLLIDGQDEEIFIIE